jgi:sugar phosphate isomerase/epimerase
MLAIQIDRLPNTKPKIQNTDVQVMYPSLMKSYKGSFPFKIATTSFIYPDHYIQNVSMLAPYLDEIELIFFESTSSSLPSKDEIGILLSLANEYDLSYNIHHPLDISLGAQDHSRRQFAIETIRQVIDLTAPLSPSTHTLHLPYEGINFKNESLQKWQEYIRRSFEKLQEAGISSNTISVETLNYPIEWVDDILMDFNLSICMDLGHLIIYGFDLKDVFARYHNSISIIHLHGANDDRDHQALDFLSKSDLKTILGILNRFKGVVSIEVFSYDHLTASLNLLEKAWMRQKI